MDLKELCSRLGSRLGGSFKEEEWQTCRVKIDPENASRELRAVFEEIVKLAKEELKLEADYLGGRFRVRKDKRDGTAGVDGMLVIYNPEDVKAIVISYDPEHRTYHITPITKRGRGCTLVMKKYGIDGYCDKNNTEVTVEGFVADL